MNALRLWLLVGAALLSPAAHAQSVDECRKITAAVERLDCYDKLPLSAISTPPAAKAQPKAAEDPFIVAARAAVRKQLRDPDSARFSDLKLKKAKDGARGVCGEVNAKNSTGGFTGPKLFVYDGKGARILISDAAQGNSTSFDRDMLGVMLGGTIKMYDQFCK